MFKTGDENKSKKKQTGNEKLFKHINILIYQASY